MVLPDTVKNTLAIRPAVTLLRTSYAAAHDLASLPVAAGGESSSTVSDHAIRLMQKKTGVPAGKLEKQRPNSSDGRFV